MTAGLQLWLAWLTCLDWWDRPVPYWYRLFLAGLLAAALGVSAALGGLAVAYHARDARPVVHARQSHAPAVTAT